ncbi:tropomyosin, partial [Salmonella sp. s51933]|uniref:tropomyosin n=1 Tax=Salmonella sp. s51933 TaxID=3160127 RepID=UPI0037540A5C
EERELAAKTNLIVAEARAENTNDEVDGLKRRLVLLQRDLEKTQERLANNQQKLDRAEGRHGGDDELRQEFEATEMERDEQLIVVEEDCVNAKKLKDEAHTVLV